VFKLEDAVKVGDVVGKVSSTVVVPMFLNPSIPVVNCKCTQADLALRSLFPHLLLTQKNTEILSSSILNASLQK
jgi:hypothetical protein